MAAVTTAVVAAAPLAGASPEPGGTFDDDNGSVHEAAIDSIADVGITKGCNPPDNTLFCPASFVTREQMATFLVRALGLPAGSVSFSDVGGSVHAADIEALASAGITKGCNPPDNTLFCPTAPVTREQMATFLARALDLATTTPLPPLPDQSPSALVTIGTDNWLYLTETLDQQCYDTGVYDRLIEEILKTEAVVGATGRDFVYSVAPNKVVINPDTSPGYAGSCADQNSIMLREAVGAAADPYRVDMWAPFAAATSDLYWKHDTHWNVDGALLGSELIAGAAAPGVWEQLDLVATPAARQGDLAALINYDWEIEYDEQTPTLPGVDPEIEVLTSIAIANRPLVTYSSPGPAELKEGGTTIIHDSFGMFFRNKLGPLFEQATFVPTFSHPIPDAARTYVTGSDQIVIEVVERNVLRDFVGTGTAGMLASVLADEFAQTAVSHTRSGEAVDFTIPSSPAGDLRYLIVELDTSGVTAPLFIGDPSQVDIGTGNGAWPDEITSDTTRYGFEIMVTSGTMQLPLPSSVDVTAAYVIVVE